MRLRNICFTINNWSPEDHDSLLKLSYKYIVIGEEVGESGTPHLQGYIEFKNPINFNTLKKKLPRAHMEKRCGTAKQASDYCKKDGTFYEDGEISNQGKRSDIDKVVELIEDGNSLKDIATLEPKSYIKFNKGIIALKNALIEPRNEKPIVQVFYGPTGTGKSHSAREVFNDCDIPYYTWTPARKTWWDGYDGHKGVLMEEFRGTPNMPLNYLLVLLDRYECPVECKGGTLEFVGTRIIITSSKHPKDWYEDASNDRIDQLLRRIDHIEYFDKVFDTKVNDTEVAG